MRYRPLFVAIGLVFLAASAQAQVRSTDSLWISTDMVTGEPKLTSVVVDSGETIGLYVWLKVEPGPGFDVGGFIAPLFYDAGNEAVIRVGQSGAGIWTGSTGSVSGATADASYDVLGPFSGWDRRCSYDKSQPASGGASELLVGFADHVPSGSGWSGRAPVTKVEITGVMPGMTSIDVGSHPVSDGRTHDLAIWSAGGLNRWRPVAVRVDVEVDAPVKVEGTSLTGFALLPSSPSPARRSTTIRFDLPRTARVSLVVYNAAGQRVAVLADDQVFGVGRHLRALDTSRLASGTYAYRLEARAEGSNTTLYRATEKLVVLR